MEINSSISNVEQVLKTVIDVNELIDTVTAVGISTRCDNEGEDSILAPLLEEIGLPHYRAKTNMGLGRLTNGDAMKIGEEIKS